MFAFSLTQLRIQELDRQLGQAKEQLRLFEAATHARRRRMRRSRTSSMSPLDNSLGKLDC